MLASNNTTDTKIKSSYPCHYCTVLIISHYSADFYCAVNRWIAWSEIWFTSKTCKTCIFEIKLFTLTIYYLCLIRITPMCDTILQRMDPSYTHVCFRSVNKRRWHVCHGLRPPSRDGGGHEHYDWTTKNWHWLMSRLSQWILVFLILVMV
jgi:hypothetical protein